VSAPTAGGREGSLEAPTRHPLDWRNPSFYDEAAVVKEMERVFDICHGCRRCFSLCNSFPTLFDAVDASPTGELDGVDKKVFWEVVDHCYLCDIAGIPVISEIVNAANRSAAGRALLEKTLGVHRDAPVPEYHSKTARKRLSRLANGDSTIEAKPTEQTRGKVALFTTCYGNRNEPELDEDLVAIFEHNGIPVTLVGRERCCGMPRLELGDLEAVAKLKEQNVPELKKVIDAGYDIVAPIPSCVLMFKQELPLMFPDDPDVKAIRSRIFDPFEYLMLRHRAGLLRTDFKKPLGKVSYHVPCHLRVQNIGLKTRDMLKLVPETTVEVIERCSGHNGTYAVKKEFRPASVKIGRPVMTRVESANPDHYSSDCPMAGHQIESGLQEKRPPTHPLRLLRIAYGID
jgi:glycerol-3-phosphate dehydrogenase subunit C